MPSLARMVVTVVLVGLVASPGLAATIYLKNGEKVEGRIVSRNDLLVTVDVGGTELPYLMKEIDRIEDEPVPAPALQAEPAKQKDAEEAFSTHRRTRRTPSEIFKQVAPAVVVITTERNSQPGQGSAFIVDPNGLVMTAAHVVRGAEAATIRLNDGRLFSSTGIVAYDLVKDVCVLAIDARALPTVSLGDSSQLEVGDPLLVISNPRGHEYTLADGLLSAFRHLAYKKEIQFSVPISAGSSGGPLLDMTGQVVGVIGSLLVDGQNLNFATPINDVKSMIHAPTRITFDEFTKEFSVTDAYLDQAAQAFIQGDSQQGLGFAEQAIARSPQRGEAHAYLASQYVKSTSPDALTKAIEHGEEAIRLDPANSYAHMIVAHAYSKIAPSSATPNHHLEAASQHFKTALQLDPAMPDANAGLAMMVFNRGDLDEARRYGERELKVAPSSVRAHFMLGVIARQAGDIDGTITSFKNAVRLNVQEELSPDTLHANLGLAYVDKRELDLARRELEHVTDPILAAELRAAIGDERLGQAAPIFGGSGTDSSGSFQISGAVISDTANEQFPSEADELIQARLNPEAGRYYYRATGIGTQDHFEVVIPNLQRAVAVAVNTPEEKNFLLKGLIVATRAFAFTHFNRGAYTEAIGPLEAVIPMMGSPRSVFWRLRLAEAYYHLGICYLKTGNRGKAEACLKELRILLPNLPDPEAKQWEQGLSRAIRIP